MQAKELNELIDIYTSAMNEVNRRVNILMNEQVHQELTSDQFATLRYVQKKQPCTSSDIAHEFAIGKSAVTAQINRMVERGLIDRQRDEEDRRIVYLSLTPTGEETMAEGTQRLYEVLGEILSEFSEQEIERFVQSLEKLVSILRKH
ncbi:MarR family winged helix-turn-helix transcriptional regulator [Sediminibacillus albus]|uniref:DNA-binding transcriptional regulator, MarR family n=1 Tax=Sediminibacillus albus TaxID=407036 RepID=A0A1G9CAB3_9BACI|nr:MarR family transcriptional regulator [Sediminibacillus albus]SDK48597.1 DNA-binding transcriptional regulator, MarR family [Sediminibacillus albus]